MPTANESRAALELVSTSAVDTSIALMGSLTGSPRARRAALLNGVPEIIGYYSEGSAALAVDFYEEERERAGVTERCWTTRVVIRRRLVGGGF
jgi:hypothetical protein